MTVDSTDVDVAPDDDPGSSPEPSLLEEVAGTRSGLMEALVVPVLAVFTALVVGALVLVFTDPDLWEIFGTGEWFTQSWDSISGAYSALFRGSFGSTRAISETLVAASPVILAGLSVAVGFRAGLFNIGGEGQVTIGGMTAIMIGIKLTAVPFPLLALLALIGGIVGGAVWGGIAGLLKARTGAHEVITTIMLNFVAAFLTLWLLKTDFFRVPDRQDPVTQSIDEGAQLPRLLTFIDPQLRVHAGIIVALLAAVFVWWLLFRSTIGYQFRAVGHNPDAARYGGMRVAWLYVAVMGVAGGLAGLAGADTVQGVLYRGTPGFSGNIGFDAIGLALLGRSHPAGVVLAGILFGALRAGGREIQASEFIPIDLVSIIQALVIVFIAAPALIRGLYRLRPSDEGPTQLTKGWGA
ncbi:MAG: ABC transporter permease [Actinomycetota bacterium]